MDPNRNHLKSLIGDYLYKLASRSETNLRPPKGVTLNSLHESIMGIIDFREPVDPKTVGRVVLWSLHEVKSDYQPTSSETEKLDGAVKASVEEKTLLPLLLYFVEKGIYADPDLPPPVVDEKINQKITRAWGTDYQGKAHETLLANIRSSYNPSPYGNTGAIIQSSGYGKSRTVDEMAKLIPTIPMNIRPARESTQGAFPDPDPSLNSLFDKFADHFNTANYAVYGFHCFFKLLFSQMVEVIEGLKLDIDFAVSFRAYFERYRKSFYEKLYADFWAFIDNDHTEGEPQNLRNQRASEARCALNALMEKVSPSAVLPVLPPQVSPLQTSLPRVSPPVSLVMYVDEAHTLVGRGIKTSENLYDLMVKACAEYRTAPFFILFLSTSSNLSELARPGPFSDSSRMKDASEYLVAPFTEMPFDCHPRLLDRMKPNLSLKDVQEPSFIVSFGRPLFWTFFEAITVTETKSPSLAYKELTDLVASKLIGRATHHGIPEATAAKFAVLDALLNLDYNPFRQTSTILTAEMAATMVASHMRTAYSVPASRAFMYTGYPSEPVMADSALFLIDQWDKLPSVQGDAMAKLFLEIDRDPAGAIDHGERGENVGKMIVLRAYMGAVKKDTDPKEPLQWSKGCSLTSFLECLTAERFHDVVLTCLPDTPGAERTPLSERFKNAWVRFTHFARAADDFAMTSSMAWVAFLRCMAMVGWPSQESVDVHIPLLLDKDRPISEANVTGLLIQIKARETSSGWKVAVNAEDANYFPLPNSPRDPYPDSVEGVDPERRAHRSRPYISLVMELGVVAPADRAIIPRHIVERLDRGESPEKENHGSKTSIPIVIASPPSITHHRKDVHPRYSIIFRGRSPEIYGCIPQFKESKGHPNPYNILLRVGGLLNDHPAGRQTDHILHFKPFWYANNNSLSWIEDNNFQAMGVVKPPSAAPTEQPSALPKVEGVVIREGAGSEGEAMDADEDTPMG